MRRILSLLALATVAAVAASSASAGTSVGVTIRHQMRGCHSWSVAGNTFLAAQTSRVAHGTSFTFTNNDVMPHTLVQLAGPKVALHTPTMGRVGARTTIVLRAPGIYRFKTKAGEDYPSMAGMKTIGEDNVLRLTVVVR